MPLVNITNMEYNHSLNPIDVPNPLKLKVKRSYKDLTKILSNKDCVCPAIGIDDTIIFLAAWRSTDPKESVEKRLALTYERSAVSVTLTSVTNCASFLACTSMPTLATGIFGIYAINFCLLVYIYQLTFMGGIMALTGRLEAAGYHGMLPCVRVKDETGKYRFLTHIFGVIAYSLKDKCLQTFAYETINS
ncbi:PTCHD3 [Cordylochernes scorpioides]|uniref:PTCHD3 n=1 Tax=Cordylochernes scorpioides TaxID=51811 RepID=A0ABY6KKQ7_9ARAC|nr:PTCHD3 [Cordylochernes scorpioides]